MHRKSWGKLPSPLNLFGVAAVVLVLGGIEQAKAGTVVLTFEGCGDSAQILNFYNGGTDSAGNSGPNYGISFSSNSLCSISQLAGGSGNFQGNPSGVGTAFFLNGTADTMNVAAGFTTGFSFYYSSAQAGSINVWSGQNDTGTLLTTLSLGANNQNHCAPGSTQTFCSWDPIGVTFTGTAESVDFAGVANEVGFDNITLGASVPAPEPSTALLLSAGIVTLVARRRHRQDASHGYRA